MRENVFYNLGLNTRASDLPYLRVSRLLHFMQLLCHKNAPNQLFMFWTHKTTQMTTKKFSKILRFFDFFLSIFLKIMFKNNVCGNLTTKTPKYRIDLSQISLQCSPGFRSNLLSKKSKPIIFRKFFQMTSKYHNSVFKLENGNKWIVFFIMGFFFHTFWSYGKPNDTKLVE